MAQTKKLIPRCLSNVKSKALAIDNEGYVIPCCECDNSTSKMPNYLTETYSNLKKSSNINDFESIEDIICQPIWQKFADELNQNIAPKWCYNVCGESPSRTHKYTFSTRGKKSKSDSTHEYGIIIKG